MLDTHALVWWRVDPQRLSESACEIEYKRGRDASLYRFPGNIPESIPALGFEWLPIEAEDGFCAARFSGPHRDPWDRIIAAQGWRRRLALSTPDAASAKACADWDVPSW